MKEVEGVMARVNILDNPNHIFWKLDFTDKYIREGFRKKYYVSFLPVMWRDVVGKETILLAL